MLMIEKVPLVVVLCWYKFGSLDESETSLNFSFYCRSWYIAAGSCCTQLLWMKKLLCDYGFTQDTMVIYCDNTSTINISKNPVQHSRTKHIDIRHHFICDLVKSREVALMFIPIENQLADILTKPLDGSRFESLRKAIGICDMS
jgi:phage anti-repressor protein